MDEHGPCLDKSAPMVLRRVPPERRHLARAMTAPAVEAGAGRWWEWVDAAADAQLPAAAVALTEPGGGVVVSALGVHAEDGVNAMDAYDELLQALLATLRRHCVDTVVMRSAERRVVRALLAAGFALDPDVDDRYLVAL
jgi:ribosomal protein S12 methylthiotransferase accessory factor YcaO